MIKKILEILIWLLLISGLIFLLSMVKSEHDKIKCPELNINISYKNNNYMITNDDIRKIIYYTGDSVKGQKLSDIDFELIDKNINGNIYVKQAYVYPDVEGNVNIDITQRNPIARIMTQYNKSYYIDEDGFILPVSPQYTARVVIISNLKDTVDNYTLYFVRKNTRIKDSTLLYNYYILAKYINSSDFWKAQISQIYIDEKGEMDLVPQVGNHQIIFGDTTDMEGKFEKLLILYKNVLNKIGWDKYKIINLKYKNQVVCS